MIGLTVLEYFYHETCLKRYNATISDGKPLDTYTRQGLSQASGEFFFSSKYSLRSEITYFAAGLRTD